MIGTAPAPRRQRSRVVPPRSNPLHSRREIKMTLVRWNPVFSPARELVSMQDDVNKFIDSFFHTSALRSDGLPFTPVVDIEETPEDFIIRADLPGVSQKDVKVNLMGDTLTIRGERKQESEAKNGGMHRVERVYGSFERSFRLATPVRGDQVKAQVRDGVLEIRVPKAEEAKVREVEVQVAS